MLFLYFSTYSPIYSSTRFRRDTANPKFNLQNPKFFPSCRGVLVAKSYKQKPCHLPLWPAHFFPGAAITSAGRHFCAFYGHLRAFSAPLRAFIARLRALFLRIFKNFYVFLKNCRDFVHVK